MLTEHIFAVNPQWLEHLWDHGNQEANGANLVVLIFYTIMAYCVYPLESSEYTQQCLH